MPSARLRLITLAGCTLLLGACNDTSDLAPASPDTPWQAQSADESAPPPPATSTATTTTATTATTPRQFTVPPDTVAQAPSPSGIDTSHVYSLVELIDIAQSRNPETRVAWEQARQAAIGVGIARSAYLPALTAGAIGGYQRLVFPFPNEQGFITSNSAEVWPQLAVTYLLLDFGGRAATVEEAGQRSIAANAAFTAAHQLLIFNVARAYFTVDGTDATVRAAQQALADAQVLRQSAEALYSRGLATIVEVQLARRGTAQAQFDLSKAKAGQNDAMYALLAAMDLPPTTKLRVADSSKRPLPPRTSSTVDEVLSEALHRRPDLLADVAKLRATDANIAAARSAMAPTVALGGFVQFNVGTTNVDNGPYSSVAQPQGEVLVTLNWPLYEGGLLQNKLHLAESQREEAADELKLQTDQALREVALAYDQIETGLDQYDAAVALETASEAAYQSARDSYAHGVGTLTDAASAQTGLAMARAEVARIHAQSLVNAAALAFATGELTSSADFASAAPP
jgi:outer membrane protein TolC